LLMQNAYCNGCGARVTLAETGDCPNGHARSMLRDVQDGPLQAAAIAATPHSVYPTSAEGGPNMTSRDEAAAKLIGRLTIILPAALVLVVGLYTGYAAGIQLGQSVVVAWLGSIGSMIVTGLCVALLVWDRRRKKLL
jgi:hypothetical protein